MTMMALMYVVLKVVRMRIIVLDADASNFKEQSNIQQHTF